MELFSAYLKQHKKGIFVLILFCVVFFVTFVLYRLPLKAVLYPSILCFLLGLIFVIVDFSHINRKHRQLIEVKKTGSAIITSMPKIESVEDRDYQEIIITLQSAMTNLETLASAHYHDMMEYYTLWVHQIKTPIASMRLTLQNEDTETSRKLSSNLFKIEQYVEMVLAFLRLNFSSSDYVFKEHRIDTIVKQAVAKFASEFIDRKISLSYEPSEETVVTDDKWLLFVVEQILSNALKYTPKGRIKIYMQKTKTLCIEDTGIGIAPEDLPRIFEKGFTGYNGRRDKKASGIGLYLCKKICKNLGAQIIITSKLDKGTSVQINLEQYDVKKE